MLREPVASVAAVAQRCTVRRWALALIPALHILCVSPSNAALHATDYFDSTIQIRFADAVAAGQVQLLEKLRAEGADINAVGHGGMTPCLWAVVHLSMTGLRYLLEHGANPNAQYKDGNSPISAAAMLQDSGYLHEILAHRGNVNLVNPLNGHTPVFDALFSSRNANVKALISHGADLNIFDRSNQTVAMIACANQRMELLYEMLLAGADPTLKNPSGVDLVVYIRRSLVPRSDPWMGKVLGLLKSKGLTLSLQNDAQRGA